MKSARRSRQHGFSMLEVLISMLLVATALLGQASLQASSLKMTKGAGNRLLAGELVAEIAERMESNRASARAGNYVASGSTPAAAGLDCRTTACASAELADYDLAIWQARVTALLPGASWQLTQDGTDPSLYTLVLSWQERRDNAARTSFATTGATEAMAVTATKVVSP